MKECYYTVHSWMISELHLKGPSLLVYAYLYSFGTYTGSRKNIENNTGLKKTRVYYSIKELTEAALVKVDENGNIQCSQYEPQVHNMNPIKNSQRSQYEPQCSQYEPQRSQYEPQYIIQNNTDNTTAAAAINSNIRVSNKERKSVFGIFKNVHLTDKQYSLLKDQYGEDISEAIDILSKHKYSRGREYAEDYAPLADWVADRLNKEKARRTQPAAIPQEPIIDNRNKL